MASFNDYSVAIRMACTRRVGLDGPFMPPIVTFDNSSSVKTIVESKNMFDMAIENSSLALAHFFDEDVSCDKLFETIKQAGSKSGQDYGIVGIRNKGLWFLGCNPYVISDIRTCIIGLKPYIQPETPQPKRLSGKIAIVTGGAQGFGRGIASELLAQGACVAITDINETTGQQCASELNAQASGQRACFFPADVSNSASLSKMVEDVVGRFGGVDLFIANAGVLKAGGIEELTEASFDLVTTINYKAFFLCTRSITPLFKLQHKYNTEQFMDIVQINSKSGLEGSNRNFAYSGSKFGGIGLVQSFALELIGHNVKVNAICPGNYYEGPLWSDPNNGLFVQYLNTGKVPGAKTIEDVRNFYLSKSPIKRGCSPLDVTRAIIYLHEQEYETGQALPVTGGQVMLS